MGVLLESSYVVQLYRYPLPFESFPSTMDCSSSSSSSSDDEDYARSAGSELTSSAVGRTNDTSASSRNETRRTPSAAAAAPRSSASEEVVILDDSSDESDGEKDAVTTCTNLSTSTSLHRGNNPSVPSVSARSSSSTSRPSAPIAASSINNAPHHSHSDSDSDDPDGLLSAGPTFASRGSGSGNNDATEKLKRTLSRLESLSSVASSTTTSSRTGVAGNNKRPKRTAEERAAEAAAKKAQRAREVEARKRARELERENKKRKREEEKVSRAKQVLEDKQASGKFAAEEICALVDGSLARAGEGTGNLILDAGGNGEERAAGLGQMLLSALEEKKYRAVVEGNTTLSTAMGGSNNMDNLAPTLWDGPPIGRGAGCIRWIRRDHLAGGSAALASAPSSDDNVQRTDMVMIVFHEPKAFLKLLERNASAEARDDYPELRAWLGRVRTSLASRWERRWKSDRGFGGGRNRRAAANSNSGGNISSSSSSSRIVLVLHKVQAELQRQWNSGGRRRQSFAPTSEEELNDATVWLLMEENVECQLTSSDDETVEYLASMTRALAEAPYYEDVTELHCIKKLKSDTSATTAEEKAKCAWMRQIRQVPNMSEAKARKLAEHYPTVMTLVEAYEDPGLTNDEKKRLLEDCLVEGRKSKKLSESIYRLMTSNDPNELIA